MARYLIARLSAMGDVAMLIPIVYATARANPQHEFVLMTQPLLTSLLVNPPANLEAMSMETKGRDRSVAALLQYIKMLKSGGYDAFIDLHDVLRTKAIRLSMMCRGIPTYTLQKPRKARARLIRRSRGKRLEPVPTMLSLYTDTLRSAGLSVPSEIPPLEVPELSERLLSQLGLDPTKQWVGVAPFASTESKVYDLELMQEVVYQIASDTQCQVILFGGRGHEAEELRSWSSRHPKVWTFAGELDLMEDITLMKRLVCMVSMDSANAHLAALVGCPVVSVWCATHPYAGFVAHRQSEADCLTGDLTSLPCRPCTIFGKVKHCQYATMPCRQAVRPSEILERAYHYINASR